MTTPTGYQLVPTTPTPAMVEAAEAAHMPFGDMFAALQLGIMAAPDHIPDAAEMVEQTNGPLGESCPFCAENETVITKYWNQHLGRHMEAVECKSCGAFGPVGSDPRAAWVKRLNPAPAAPGVRSSLKTLATIIENLKTGFVACRRCGDQEDTATLDCVSDLEEMYSVLAAQQVKS